MLARKEKPITRAQRRRGKEGKGVDSLIRRRGQLENQGMDRKSKQMARPRCWGGDRALMQCDGSSEGAMETKLSAKRILERHEE